AVLVADIAEQNAADENSEKAPAEDEAHGAALGMETAQDGGRAHIDGTVVEPVHEQREASERKRQRLEPANAAVLQDWRDVDVVAAHAALKRGPFCPVRAGGARALRRRVRGSVRRPGSACPGRLPSAQSQ